MKKFIILLMSLVISITLANDIGAAELDRNEKYIIESIISDNFPVKIEQRYVNQLKNYFCQNDVSLKTGNAEGFLVYLRIAEELKEKGGFLYDKCSVLQYMKKSVNELGLWLQYDSKINGFCAIDAAGNVVIDCQPIIKNTDMEISQSIDDLIYGPDILENLNIEDVINTLEDEKDDSKETTILSVVAAVLLIGGILLGIFGSEKVRKKLKKKSKNRIIKLLTKKRNPSKTFLYIYVPSMMVIIVFSVYVVGTNVLDLKAKVKDTFLCEYSINEEDRYKDIRVSADLEQKNELALSDVTWPRYGEQYGKLICENLNIDVPVFWGDRGSIMEKGAGSYCGSSIPGDGSSTLIGAHDTTYFEGLKNVRTGNIFTLLTEYGKFQYQVREIKVYDSENYDEAYNLKADKEQLILYTCYPFEKLEGAKTDRMFVYLDKVSGPYIKY